MTVNETAKHFNISPKAARGKIERLGLNLQSLNRGLAAVWNKEDVKYLKENWMYKQDIEIAAFFAAVFAWGNRTTIINKARELMSRMDNAPYEFCLQPDYKRLLGFKHRTFNDTDLLYFIEFLHQHY